jgi:hypothetical protein
VNPSTSLLSSISSEDLELDVVEWVRDILSSGSKREAINKLGVLFYLWCHVWKEMSMRIFDTVEQFVPQ